MNAKELARLYKTARLFEEAHEYLLSEKPTPDSDRLDTVFVNWSFANGQKVVLEVPVPYGSDGMVNTKSIGLLLALELERASLRRFRGATPQILTST